MSIAITPSKVKFKIEVFFDTHLFLGLYAIMTKSYHQFIPPCNLCMDCR